MSDFKILTYNIHKGFDSLNRRFVLKEIRDAIQAVDPDFVFLQEIQGQHLKKEAKIKNWPEVSQFEYLAEQVWPHINYGKNAIYRHGHHGNAILSKFPILKWENIDISKIKRSSRSILHSEIQLNNAVVHLMCIHLSLFQNARSEQLAILCDRIQSHVPTHEALIIAGDFNDWRQYAETFLESHLGLKEVFKTLHGEHAKTFPAKNPRLRVDRIYYRGLKTIKCHRFAQAPWNELSDHIPLAAEFSLLKHS